MEIDELIAAKEKREKEETAKDKERGLSYWQILQIDDETHRRRLKKVEATQKSVFKKICIKDNIHKEDWKDEFAMFWMAFLKGECKSINEYLKRRPASCESSYLKQ